ncbi:trimeric intracellular cation channel family protein [Roseovarius sp. SCSIO 43702]|uniref:trimeric intracellular cation channel family protein n=1 Tax=Roseovarius sp. SCSIO 43702 TaxID=2823043 RepID=UPI001C73DEDA|nr:trimeric intracellular cation channel family protein [Roseovarius sp. SCSIO 43702]QYX58260.1 trimeric intracellular cation channel family protein [Roseovarius sp. SCSIO 43702]
MTPLALLDYGAVAVFALTGALVASRAQLDIVGFAFLAALTGVGGGTVRDVLLDRYPIFWVDNPDYIFIAVAAAVFIFFTAHLVESRYRWLRWLDALALAVAAPAGAGFALQMGKPAVIVVLMGMATGCLGGLMRDVVVRQVPLVLREGELYVTAAFAGSLAAVIVADLMDDPVLALGACGVITFALRAGSLAFGWRLPVYRTRPPR